MTEDRWPRSLPAAQVRVARPVNDLERARAFYGEGGLGLPVLAEFRDHEGFSGVMFGLPDRTTHLELTVKAGEKVSAPHPDALLVLYLPDRAARDHAVRRLVDRGFPVVEPANPYWKTAGVTVADGDGNRVVLVHGAGLSTRVSDPRER